MLSQGFPGGSMGKNIPANVGDPGSIPGLIRSPGEGNGNPLQDSCLGYPKDRGAWQATRHEAAKEAKSDTTQQLNYGNNNKCFPVVVATAVSPPRTFSEDFITQMLGTSLGSCFKLERVPTCPGTAHLVDMAYKHPALSPLLTLCQLQSSPCIIGQVFHLVSPSPSASFFNDIAPTTS